MTPIGRHEPIRARRHRILICGVLVHVTVTTDQHIGCFIIRTHCEREIVSSTLLGMRSRSCESVRYRLRHALATSVGRGKSCERHFLVKLPIFFRSWWRERVKPSLPPSRRFRPWCPAPGIRLAAAGSLDWGAPMAHIEKLRKGGAQVLGGRRFVNIHNNQTKFS